MFGSDAPGVVRLRELATGHMLGSEPIDLLQMADRVPWTNSTADVERVAR